MPRTANPRLAALSAYEKALAKHTKAAKAFEKAQPIADRLDAAAQELEDAKDALAAVGIDVADVTVSE